VREWRAESFDFDTVDHVRVEVDELIEAADGETVVMAVRTLGHSKRFEMDYEVPWAAVWTIREGKLVEAEGYLHMADALDAAGLRE
jgi:ketosteroid isomerase-like protein